MNNYPVPEDMFARDDEPLPLRKPFPVFVDPVKCQEDERHESAPVPSK